MFNLFNSPSLFDITNLFSAFAAGVLFMGILYEIFDRRQGKVWIIILVFLLLLNVLMATNPLWLKGA